METNIINEGLNAAQLTKFLKAYGEGNMVDGINKVFCQGQKIGAIKTALGAGVTVLGLYILTKGIQEYKLYKKEKDIITQHENNPDKNELIANTSEVKLIEY